MIQICDWYAKDETTEHLDDSSDTDDDSLIENSYVIYLFGVTFNGTNVAIKVLNYEPYFWIRLPDWKLSWTSILIDFLQSKLPRNMRNELILDEESQRIHKKFIFRDYQWNRRKLFLKLRFKSEKALRYTYYTLKKEINIPTINLKNHLFPIFEKNVSPLLRFIHLKEIKPSSWIELGDSATQLRHGDTIYENWEVNWNHVHKIENDSIYHIFKNKN